MLNLVLDNLDGLAEPIAAEYEPGTGALEGKFVLSVKSGGGLAVEDVSGLKSSLEAARGERDAALKKSKAFEGLDPAEAKKALAKVGEMAKWDPDKEVAEKIAAREAELVKAHNSALEGEKTRADTLSQQLEKNLVVAAATEALQKAGGRIALLLPHVKSQVRMRQTDSGEFIAEVFNPETNQPRVGDTQGNPMTIPQLVEEMRGSDDYAAAFDGTGNTGSGAGGSAGSGKKAGAGTPTGQAGKVKTVSRSDQNAMNQHWQEIAAGTVEVVD